MGHLSKQCKLYFCAHKSPRSEHYNYGDCGLQNFDLNSYIRTQTSNLDIWSIIRVRISHQKDQYGGQGKTKEFEIVLRKDMSFDIEVSFPAGLITIEQPEKINVQPPYKIGVGYRLKAQKWFGLVGQGIRIRF